MKNLFDKDYFVDSDISNYKDYRLKKFHEQAVDLFDYLNLKDGKNKSILDYGCATGGLLYELKTLGCENVMGMDVSDWALDYGRTFFGLKYELKEYGDLNYVDDFDYIFAFDVLEHMYNGILDSTINKLRYKLKDTMLVRVPVSLKEGDDYHLEVSRNDKTHIQIHSRDWWIDKLQKAGLTFVEDLSLRTIYSSDGVFAGNFRKERK